MLATLNDRGAPRPPRCRPNLPAARWSNHGSDRRAADLSLDIADLGAAHLGATHLHDLALAGRVVEHTPGALAAASTAWAWSPTATCPEIF